MTRVLVTGGAGFIGSNLVKRCVDEGWTVDVVDDLSNGHVEFLPPDMTRIEPGDGGLSTTDSTFFHCDFSMGTPIQRIRNGLYNVVFHLAAVPRVSYSVEHPLETNDVNVTRTLRLLDACRGNVKRVVFASSSSVYGGADVSLGPTHENHPKNPKSPYAIQKSIIEDYLVLYSELYGLDSACLRFFNVFGPNCLGSSPYSTAISAWLTSIKKEQPLRFDGDGSQSRDLCYVDNVVDACIRAAKHLTPLKAECFNVGCGDRITNLEIYEHLLDRYPKTLKIDAPWRSGDVMHTQADVTKIKIILGYTPLVRVHDGLQKTCDWYDKNWSIVSNFSKGI